MDDYKAGKIQIKYKKNQMEILHQTAVKNTIF